MQHARRYFLKVGLIAALVALVLDQAAKLWLLSVFDIANRGAFHLTPFFDVVLTWNKGISYGWFQTTSANGELLLLGVKIAAVVGLLIWLTRVQSTIAAIGLGLIIGGAVGNAIDRFSFGAVMDFALFHVEIAGKDRDWYVFNLADVAIVAGVVGLLYDSFVGAPAAKVP
jgi:signal peptidase II